jgi:CubicO group peptidase (beta-lactamase class C family)
VSSGTSLGTRFDSPMPTQSVRIGAVNKVRVLVIRSGIASLIAIALAAQVLPVSARPNVEKTQSMQRSAPAAQQTNPPPKISDRLQRTLERSRANSVTPGAQAAVIRDGELVWLGEDGRAVRQPRRRVSKNTLFCFASFGKMMLAAFTLRQVEAWSSTNRSGAMSANQSPAPDA